MASWVMGLVTVEGELSLEGGVRGLWAREDRWGAEAKPVRRGVVPASDLIYEVL